MARIRKANPEPRQKQERDPDYYWDVQYMDVEIHLSKAKNISIRVDYTVEEREWPVSEYFGPNHKKETPRRMWREFKAEMSEAGHTIPMAKTYEEIVKLSKDWLMPSRIGITVEDAVDDEGRSFENINVVDRDWSESEEQGEDNEEEAKKTAAEKKPDDDDLPF